MGAQMKYGIRVVRHGGTFYLRSDNLTKDYVDIEDSSSTEDLLVLDDWIEYVDNDLSNGSINSYKIVEFLRTARIVTPNVDGAARQRALNKLNARDKAVLGL